MREICTPGSVRGAARKGRPYRDRGFNPGSDPYPGAMRTQRLVMGLCALGLIFGGCKSAEEKAQEHVEAGKRALSSGDLDKADAEFRAAENTASTRTAALDGRAKVALERKDAKGAFNLAARCGEPCTETASAAAKVLKRGLEGKPLGDADYYVEIVEAAEGNCGLFGAIDRAKKEPIAKRAPLLRALKRAIERQRVSVQNTESATLAGFKVAKAAGEEAASASETCDDARHAELEMHGNYRSARGLSVDNAPPSSVKDLNESEQRGKIFWYYLLKARLEGSPPTPPAANVDGGIADGGVGDGGVGDGGLAEWPPKGAGCASLVNCCKALDEILPSSFMCRIILSQQGDCAKAQHKITTQLESKGMELPRACQ